MANIYWHKKTNKPYTVISEVVIDKSEGSDGVRKVYYSSALKIEDAMKDRELILIKKDGQFKSI